MGQKYEAGAAITFRWIWSGGTLDFSGDYTKFSPGFDIEMLDGSAGNDADRVYVPGKKDGTASLTVWDTVAGGSIYEQAFAVGNGGSLYWGTQGSAAGKPKRAIFGYVKSFKPKLDFDSLAAFDIEIQKSGAVLAGPTAVWP